MLPVRLPRGVFEPLFFGFARLEVAVGHDALNSYQSEILTERSVALQRRQAHERQGLQLDLTSASRSLAASDGRIATFLDILTQNVAQSPDP